MARQRMPRIQKLLSITDLSQDVIIALVERALAYKMGKSYHFLEPQFVANVLCSDETRQQYSMKMAQKRLGIKSIDVERVEHQSMYDTLMTLAALNVHVLVANGGSSCLKQIHCGVISMGDGQVNNPLNSLEILLTIYEQFQRFSNITVGLIGNDVPYYSFLSDVSVLTRLGANIIIADSVKLEVNALLENKEIVSSQEVLQKADVIILSDTVLKHEQLLSLANAQIKSDSIVLYSGKLQEQLQQLIELPHSRILQQYKNSMYMNMAVLESVLS